MITIDKTKCVGCGQCIDICPFTVLRMGEDHKAECTEKNCIKCMHCAAICPAEAITYDHQKAVMKETKRLPEHFADDLETFVQQRRSYRKFKEEKIERTKIVDFLKMAELAPSAKNQHPTKWIVIDNASLRDELMQKILEFCRKNNVVQEVVTEYENGNNPVMGENATLLIGYCLQGAIHPTVDTAIALTTIELMMQAEGIGSFWGGYLARFLELIPGCKELLGLPEGAKVEAALLFGYPKQAEYRRVPARLEPAEVTFI